MNRKYTEHEMYEDLKLPEISKGAHREDSGQLCAMELVAFMERLPHSDSPPCTCPVLASYTRTLNDRMPNEQRQHLLPLLSRLVGTVNPSLEQKRAEHFALAMVTRLVPLALEGKIDPTLIVAMQGADSLDAAYAAAYAADCAVDAAVDAAYAADAARAAYAAYAAAYAADCAADAALVADAARAAYFWDMAVDILVEAIELDPAIKPASWSPDRALEAVALTA